MSKRRTFSAEFKRGAVEQARQPGVSCAQVARELGIGDNLLTRWKREFAEQGRASPGAAAHRNHCANSNKPLQIPTEPTSRHLARCFSPNR